MVERRVNRFRDAANAANWRYINAASVLLWVAVIPISVWRGWIESVDFVSILSIYAIVVAHVAAWRSDVQDQPTTPLGRGREEQQ